MGILVHVFGSAIVIFCLGSVAVGYWFKQMK